MRALVLPLLIVPSAVEAQAPIILPPGLLVRAEALALIEQLNGLLLASPSATLTLEQWCGDHGLATTPKITAEVDRGAVHRATPQQRADLEVGPDEPLGYRRVRLMCGARALSQAENWYVPSRLTSAMNAALAASDVPFGRLILPLGPRRHTIAVERLWSPLPAGWDRSPPSADAPLPVPDALFRHRALVTDAQGQPLAEVAETYTSQNLASLVAKQ